ncbi:MAG: hypothetical protein ACOY93_03205 [Bacillota bacterium]
MTAVQWPTWIAWLLAIAVVLTLLLLWALLGRVASIGGALREAGISPNAFRSRRELEAAYTAGTITRDAYERLKGRLP